MLTFGGKPLGQVLWRDGRIVFDPPLFADIEPALTNAVFTQWVERAEFRNSTGI